MKKRNRSNSKLIIMFYLFVHFGLMLICIPGSDKSAFVTFMCYWRYYECNGKCYLNIILLTLC